MTPELMVWIFIWLCMILPVGLTLYFLPAIVARIRHHPQMLAIVMLNLFLGWTFLGWVAALCLACTTTETMRQARALPQHEGPYAY